MIKLKSRTTSCIHTFKLPYSGDLEPLREDLGGAEEADPNSHGTGEEEVRIELPSIKKFSRNQKGSSIFEEAKDIEEQKSSGGRNSLGGYMYAEEAKQSSDENPKEGEDGEIFCHEEVTDFSGCEEIKKKDFDDNTEARLEDWGKEDQFREEDQQSPEKVVIPASPPKSGELVPETVVTWEMNEFQSNNYWRNEMVYNEADLAAEFT